MGTEEKKYYCSACGKIIDVEHDEDYEIMTDDFIFHGKCIDTDKYSKICYDVFINR